MSGVTVHLSSHVRAYTGGRKEVPAEGGTLAEIVDDLESRHPGIRFRLIDEQGRIRTHMNFFVGEEMTRDLAHPVREGEDVHILGALSGG